MKKLTWNKQTLAVTGAIVTVLVLGMVWVFTRTNVDRDSASWRTGAVDAPVDPHTEDSTAPEEPTPAPTTTSGSTPPRAAALTYEEAVEKYGGFRFQFISCRGTPGTMTLKKGSAFLLDNRDNKAHTIKVGTKSYALAAYGFKVATASETGTLNITCDGGGAAQITVQP